MIRYTLSLYILVFFLFAFCNGKKYSKCEFAQKMKESGVTSLEDLGTWTCIAYYESLLDTEAINKKSGDYGILQFNHQYWCSDTDKPGKGCNITCKSLLSDDITEDIKCAKHVFAETAKDGETKNGFTAWVVYKRHCSKESQSSFIKSCKL